MIDFEILDRDGLARLGRFETPHGRVETPALLPVLHPDPSRQAVGGAELAPRFGVRAVISSAYIAFRTPALRATAETRGIHHLLGFEGTVMTDSGAFQQHAYGSVEVEPDRILDFQNRIGSDIATVLDDFGEPDADERASSASVDTTIERSLRARGLRTGLLATPVQGGRFETLRRRAAEAASRVGDVLAIGGVVPLLEQYRFSELSDVLAAARPGLAPERAVHLFGTGHPISFAFAALLGVDLFDSAAYHKFARRGALLFPEGTRPVESVREALCACWLCAREPLTAIARLGPAARERAIARHNLLQSLLEVGRVRQAIREGTLWELVERRAAAHPALRAGLRHLVQRPEPFLATEPWSRPAFREVGETSRLRPAIARFRARERAWRTGRGPFRATDWRPLLPRYLATLPPRDESGAPLYWEQPTPIGPVPIELSELYPVGSYLSADEFDPERSPHRRPAPAQGAGRGDREEGWVAEWTRRQVEALLEWAYDPAIASVLTADGSAVRSRRTGRLRGWVRDGRRLLSFENDGLPIPTWEGAKMLHRHLPAPRLRVVVREDAVPFLREGRSLFARFVRSADPALHPGEPTLLVDEAGDLVAVGRLLLTPDEMVRMRRGVAARVTTHARSLGAPPGHGERGDRPAGGTASGGLLRHP